MNDHAPAAPFRVLGEMLLETPDTVVAGVLSGRLALGTQQRAEPEDIVADLLAHPVWQEQRDVLSDRLDRALLTWIEERAVWTLKRIAGYGTRAYAAELSDALAIASRLPLPRTAREFVEHQPVWDNRLGTLRWPGEIDLLRQLDMVLVSHQAETRFAPRWFASCDRAAWGGPIGGRTWRPGSWACASSPIRPGRVPSKRLPPRSPGSPPSRLDAAWGNSELKRPSSGGPPPCGSSIRVGTSTGTFCGTRS